MAAPAIPPSPYGVDLAARAAAFQPDTVVIFGDSISAQNTDGVAGAVTTQTNGNGYFTVANAILGHRFRLLNNGGISGQTTTQILARVQADVIAYKPGNAIVLAGQNDTTGTGGQTVPSDTSIANLLAIYTAIRANGIRLIACTMTCTSQLASGGDAAIRRGNHTQINNFIREYARLNPDVRLVDFDYATTDPTTGLPLANAFRDGVHPSYLGIWQYMAPALAEVLASIVPAQDQGSISRYDARNYAFNAGAVGSNASGTNGFVAGPGVTGTGPNGWATWRRATATGAASPAARQAGWRSDPLAQMAMSFTALGDGIGFSFGGDDVQATGRFDLAWAVNQTIVHGARRKPTVANGMIYTAQTSGTTGSTEPAWTTQEADIIIEGSITWFAQKAPVAGDKFIAECDVLLSGFTAGKGAHPRLLIAATDTTGAGALAYDMQVDLQGTLGAMPQSAPSTLLRLQTPVITIPTSANPLRYLRGQIGGYGEAGATLTMQVGRCRISRIS